MSRVLIPSVTSLRAGMCAPTARWWAGALLALVSACADTPTSVVVTIAAQPSVGAIDELKVRVASDGVGQDRVFNVKGKDLPHTFSVSTDTLNAALLEVNVEASLDSLPVAVGRVDAKFNVGAVTLMLQPTDFVVNDKTTGEQALHRDYEVVGFQIASFPDGTFDVAFRADAQASYAQHGRRFTVNGRPVSTAAAGGNAAEWTYSTPNDSAFSASTAIAANARRSVAVWDFAAATGPTGIYCRSVSLDGAINAAPVLIANDVDPDVVSIATLTNSNFVVQFTGKGAQQANPEGIRGVIIDENCNVKVQPFAVSTTNAATVKRGVVAARAEGIFFSWINDTQVKFRRFGVDGTPQTATEETLAGVAAGALNQYVRVTPMGDGWGASLVQELKIEGVTTRRLLVQRLSLLGVPLRAPTILSPDTHADSSTALFSRGGNAPVFAAWFECKSGLSACDGEIWGQVLRPNGLPMGEKFQVNTTTAGDQDDPVVVQLGTSDNGDPIVAYAWTDDSRTAPDTSMLAVRARIMYPQYDTATSTLGADCKAGKPDCKAGLACLGTTEGTPRCVAVCDPGAAGMQCAGGGTCTKQGTAAGCIF